MERQNFRALPAALSLGGLVMACLTDGTGGATNDQGGRPGPIYRLFAPHPTKGLAMCDRDPAPPGGDQRRRTRDRRTPHPQDTPPRAAGWMTITPAMELAPLPAGASIMSIDQDPPPAPVAPDHWTTSIGASYLRRGDLAGWFRWVFLDLDRHAGDCRWVATLRLIGVAR